MNTSDKTERKSLWSRSRKADPTKDKTPKSKGLTTPKIKHKAQRSPGFLDIAKKRDQEHSEFKKQLDYWKKRAERLEEENLVYSKKHDVIKKVFKDRNFVQEEYIEAVRAIMYRDIETQAYGEEIDEELAELELEQAQARDFEPAEAGPVFLKLKMYSKAPLGAGEDVVTHRDG